jgi:hypothetical protein
MVKRFQEYEIDYLKKNYGNVPTQEICFNLSRTLGTIHSKVSELKIIFNTNNIKKLYIRKCWAKGKKISEIMPIERWKEYHKRLVNRRKGKTYEEIYGKIRAKSEINKRNNSKTLRKLFKSGKIKSWNKGLTKHTDRRVLKNAIAKIGIKRNDVIIRNKNPIFIKKVLKSLYKRPTSFELKLIDFFKKYQIPFDYVGNGDYFIKSKNPDFLYFNKKLVIEVFYSYFKIRDYGSVNRYKRFCKRLYTSQGFKVIFIDEKIIESNNFEEICLRKINNFVKQNI